MLEASAGTRMSPGNGIVRQGWGIVCQIWKPTNDEVCKNLCQPFGIVLGDKLYK